MLTGEKVTQSENIEDITVVEIDVNVTSDQCNVYFFHFVQIGSWKPVLLFSVHYFEGSSIGYQAFQG